MENVKKDYFMDNHFRRKLHENIVKTRVLQSGFWNAKVTAWRCKRHCMSRKCCTIPIFGRFLESCYIAHPRSHGKVPKNPVRGYGIRGKTAFRQEKCRMIRNLPRKSESCNKIRRSLPWVLLLATARVDWQGAGPATFAVKRLGDSIDSGYSCESELVLHCFAERSQIQIRVFICQVSENPMQPPPKQR